MIKFEVDFNIKELTDQLEYDLNLAVASTAAVAAQKARSEAANRLRSGLKHWNRGFDLIKIREGEWALVISGKLANMMEDGFEPQEFKDMMLRGTRAKYNAKSGKKYVDVPMALDDNALTGELSKTNVKVNVQQFRDLDSLVTSFTKTENKKVTTGHAVNMQRLIVKRGKEEIENIIKARSAANSKNPMYLKIRRLTETSEWPDHPYKGAHIFESLDQVLEQIFEHNLNKFIGG